MLRPAGVLVPLLRHTFAFLGTVLGASALLSVLLALVPGDAIDTLPNGDELRPQLAEEWQLQGPLPLRIGGALLRTMRGDLGVSLTTRPGVPVSELIASNTLHSLTLVGAGLGVGALAAVLVLAMRSRVAMAATAAVSAVPAALLALALVNWINTGTFHLIERGIIARPAWFALPGEDSLARTGLAIFVLAVASAQLGGLVRLLAAGFSELQIAPFVIAERCRGGRLGPLYVRHLAVPLVRALASSLPGLLSSLIVVERGMGLGGCGALFWLSVQFRDWPLAAGLASAAALLVAAGRLGAEAFAVLWDPRERDLA